MFEACSFRDSCHSCVLIYRHKSLLGVDQAPNKRLRERIREATPFRKLEGRLVTSRQALMRVLALSENVMNKL